MDFSQPKSSNETRLIQRACLTFTILYLYLRGTCPDGKAQPSLILKPRALNFANVESATAVAMIR